MQLLLLITWYADHQRRVLSGLSGRHYNFIFWKRNIFSAIHTFFTLLIVWKMHVDFLPLWLELESDRFRQMISQICSNVQQLADAGLLSCAYGASLSCIYSESSLSEAELLSHIVLTCFYCPYVVCFTVFIAMHLKCGTLQFCSTSVVQWQ